MIQNQFEPAQLDMDSAVSLIKQQKKLIHQLQTVMNEMPGSIYWKDKEGVYLGHNSFSKQKMTDAHLPCESIIGKTDYDLFPKTVADQYRVNDLKVMETGGLSVDEEEIYLKNDTPLFQLSYKRPLKDEAGKIIGIIGNTVDITALKMTEMALREAKQKIETLYQSRTELLMHMAHDIRTPFCGILGLTHLLEGQETDLEKKSSLSCVAQSAQNLLDYCNHLLNFLKSEYSQLPVLEERFNLKKLIEEVVTIERPAAQCKNLALLFDYDVQLPNHVIGDPERIKRILINLVSNALKFTNEGHVRIFVRFLKKTPPKTLIYQLVIEDTGVGISEEKKRALYETFNNLKSETYKHGGYGLGLPMVKSFIHDLGAEIEVNTQLGKGTQFICTIPFIESLSDQLVSLE